MQQLEKSGTATYSLWPVCAALHLTYTGNSGNAYECVCVYVCAGTEILEVYNYDQDGAASQASEYSSAMSPRGVGDAASLHHLEDDHDITPWSKHQHDRKDESSGHGQGAAATGSSRRSSHEDSKATGLWEVTSVTRARGSARGSVAAGTIISRGADRLPTPILKRTGTLRETLIEEGGGDAKEARVEFRNADHPKNVAFR